MANAPERFCPYCRKSLSRWANPEFACWTGDYQYVCFNDECPYFVRGWEWMERHFQVRTSYRHRMDPVTGEAGPLPVWSKDAFKNLIIAEEGSRHD